MQANKRFSLPGDLSALFPSSDPDRALADAITGLICLKIPGLDGMSPGEKIREHYRRNAEQIFGEESSASEFGADILSILSEKNAEQSNLSQAAIDRFNEKLYQGLREHRRNASGPLQLYLRDERETKPEWFKAIVESSAADDNLSLYSLMPYRMKLAFMIHEDGQLFQAESSYGPADNFRRVQNYPGQPETDYEFIDDITDLTQGKRPSDHIDLGLHDVCFVSLAVAKRMTQKIRGHWSLAATISQYIDMYNKMLADSTLKPGDAKRCRGKLIELNDILDKVRGQGIDSSKISTNVFLMPRTGERADTVISDPIVCLTMDGFGMLKEEPGVIEIEYDKLFEGVPVSYVSRTSAFPVMPMDRLDANFSFEGDSVHVTSQPIRTFRADRPIEFGAGGDNVRLKAGDVAIVARDEDGRARSFGLKKDAATRYLRPVNKPEDARPAPSVS